MDLNYELTSSFTDRSVKQLIVIFSAERGNDLADLFKILFNFVSDIIKYADIHSLSLTNNDEYHVFVDDLLKNSALVILNQYTFDFLGKDVVSHICHGISDCRHASC